MMVPLRLSGHQPDTLINDFKNARSMSIRETVINYLDEQISNHGNLTKVPVGRMAYIIMGVLAICENPNNFYGYDLYQPLRLGVNTFNNYFEYSLVVIALCNGGVPVPRAMVNGLVRFANRRYTTFHFVDTNALVLLALSCVKSTRQVRQASRKLAWKILSKQNRHTGAFGNQYSTALAAEVNIPCCTIDTVPDDIITYHTIPYTISYALFIQYYIPYHTILYHTILYTIPYYTIPYYTIPCYIPYHTIPYYTILYYTILYYTILYKPQILLTS